MSKLGHASDSYRDGAGSIYPPALIQRNHTHRVAATEASRQESTCVAQVIADRLSKLNRKHRSSIVPNSHGCSLYGERFWAQ